MENIKDISIILQHQYLDDQSKVKYVQRKFNAINPKVTNEQVQSFKRIVQSLSEDQFMQTFITKTIQLND